MCVLVYMCAHVYPYARISASFTVAYYACVSFFHAFIAQVCFVERSNLPLIKGRQVCYRPYSNEDHKCVLIIPLRVIVDKTKIAMIRKGKETIVRPNIKKERNW